MKSYVYFVLDTVANMVKIGYTAKPEGQRFKSVYSPYGGEMKLLGVMEGGKDLEREIHNRFSKARNGKKEWFRFTPEICQFIEQKTVWNDFCSKGQEELHAPGKRRHSSIPKRCLYCGKTMRPGHPSKLYCTDAHRVAAWRERQSSQK